MTHIETGRLIASVAAIILSAFSVGFTTANLLFQNFKRKETNEREGDAMSDDWMTTDCARCDAARAAIAYAESGHYADLLVHRMILCPTCGNKRCPKATWHGNDCTGSNEPNQAGSDYRFGVIPR